MIWVNVQTGSHLFGSVSSLDMHAPVVTTTRWTAFLPRQLQRVAGPLCAIVMLILCTASSLRTTDLSSHTDEAREQPFHWAHNEPTRFPRRIWQTWKVNPFGFEERDHAVARTWLQNNPTFRYEVLTDDNAVYYVESHFGPTGLNRPDIVHTYRSLTAKIVKADLLRYLVMYIEGGVYADIDVEALRSIERFIPSRFDEGDVDMVIGIEIDQPQFRNHPILGPKSMSFCQWTFMSKPRQPVMLDLIDGIITWINEVAHSQNVALPEMQLDFDAVLTGTGPSAFTNAIMRHMSAKAGYEVQWDTFHAMDESKVVGGILVLTVEAFAAGQGHSDSGNHNAKQALVKHHYHASQWPSNHPRYKHPIFGEVERCNWVEECVRVWDENKAAFDLLPHEEQLRQIAAHEAEEIARQQLFLQSLENAQAPALLPNRPDTIQFPPT